MTLFKSVNYLRRLQRNRDHEAEIKMELTDVEGKSWIVKTQL